MLWVQIRSGDRLTANPVLDDVRDPRHLTTHDAGSGAFSPALGSIIVAAVRLTRSRSPSSSTERPVAAMST